MGISRRSEVAWHLRMGNLPLLHVEPKLHERLDSLSRLYEGKMGAATLFPRARITTPRDQKFEARALRAYVGGVSMSRLLMTPCTVEYNVQAPNGAAPREESIRNDYIQLSVQYSGASAIVSGDVRAELPLGSPKYTCSRYKFEVTYSGLSDLFLVVVPVSRILDLVDALRAHPAAMFPDTATTDGAFAFLTRFLFKHLTGPEPTSYDESSAENAVVALTRAVLAPLLREWESGDSDPEVRRAVEAEIEAHHRDSALTVDSIASLIGISRRQLYRATGDQLAKKLDLRRSQSARELIETDPDLHLTVVANLSGFTNATRMRDNFVRAYGILPSAFRAKVKKNRQ